MTRSAPDSRQAGFEGPFKCIFKGIFKSGKSAKTHDRAFEWLERADTHRDPGLVEVQAEILLRNVYGDPRWRALLKRMRLEDRTSTSSGETAV